MPNNNTTDKSILAYFHNLPSLHFERGETIINGAEEPKGIFLIKKGFVKAYSTSILGHTNLLTIHKVGEFMPLPWALDGDSTTGLFYEAMSDVTVLCSPKSELRSAMGQDPWLSQEILKQAVTIIESYTQRIQTLEFRSAKGKVVSELLNLAERFGSITHKGIVIEAPITHQDIADSINMIRETASRTIEILCTSGYIEQADHTIIIKNLSAMQSARE